MFKEGISIRLIISISKAFFITSVIIAHTPLNSEIFLLNTFFEVLGTIGVVGFFMISGYLFGFEKRSFFQFIKRKAERIVLPWFACGTFVYILSSKFGSNLEQIRFDYYLRFLLGYGSLYYYLSMLLIIYVIFYFVRTYTNIIYLFCLITPIYIVLTYLNVFPDHYQYLSIFSWISFFSIGYVFNKKKILESFLFYGEKNFPIVAMLFTVSILISIISKQTTYFSPINIITEVLGVIFVLIYSKKVCKTKKWRSVLEFIGNKSFSIYLLHMPIAGLINLIFERLEIQLFGFLKPLVMLIVLSILLRIYVYVIHLFNQENPKVFFLNLIGLR